MSTLQKIGIVILNVIVISLMINELMRTPIYSESDLRAAQERAVTLAREGDLKTAQTRLLTLSEYAKDRQSLWEDYITVLHWDKQDAKALLFVDKIDLKKSPAYFLDTLINVAANEKNWSVLLAALKYKFKLAASNNDNTIEPRVWSLFDQFVNNKANHYAIILLKHIRILSPLNNEDLLKLIQSHRVLNSPEQGKLINELYERDDSIEQINELWLQQQVLLARSGYSDTAMENIDKHIEKRPEDSAARFEYTTIASWDGNNRNPLKHWKSTDIESAPAYVLNAAAKSLRDQKKFQSSLEHYQESLKRDPSQDDAKLGLTYSLIDMKQYAKAESHIKKLDGENRSRATKYLAASKITSKKILSPSDIELIAYRKRNQGKHKEALKYYRQGEAKAPDNAEFHLGQALVLNELKKYQKSSIVSAQALQRWPSNLSLHKAHTDSLIHLGYWERALVAQENILAHSPSNSNFQEWANINSKLPPENQLSNYHRLQSAYPEQQWLLGDAIAANTYQEKYKEAAALTPALNSEKAQSYVLEAAALAERRIGNHQKAYELYEVSQKRFPNNPEFHLGYALTLIDQGKNSEAESLLLKLDKRFPQHRGIMHTLAMNYRYMNKNSFALSQFQRILQIFPENQMAYREWVMTLNSLGSAEFAFELAQKEPEAFSKEHWKALHNDRTAIAIRSSILYEKNLQTFLSRLNKAERYSKEYQDFLDDYYSEDTQTKFYAKADHILLLKVKKEYEPLIEEYQLLSRSPHAIPEATHYAAADAYLALQKPKKAQKILDQYPDRNPSMERLFYTHLDTMQADTALELSNELVKRNPAWRASDQSRFLLPNSKRRSADLMNKLHPAYVNKLGLAQKELEAFLSLGAANTEIRSHLATVYRWRGLPRKAMAEFELIKSVEPDYTDANIGRIYTQIDLKQYKDIEADIEELEKAHYKSTPIKQLKRDWELLQSPSLRVTASTSKGEGSRFASRDQTIESYLQSSLLNNQFRLFNRITYKRNEQLSSINMKRYGLGLSWEQNDWALSSEVNQSFNGSNTGISLSADWFINDHWNLNGSFQSYSDQTPIRAFNEGIDLRSTNLKLNYHRHESFKGSLNIGFGKFSDGNQRNDLGLNLFQGVYRSEKHQWNTRQHISLQSNDAIDTPYFNPESLTTLGIGVDYIGTLYQRYEKHFKHRISLDLDLQNQKSFGQDMLWGIDYEHQWQVSKSLNGFYGISYAVPVYDGQTEKRYSLYAGINWRF